jgi:hypothetical protein
MNFKKESDYEIPPVATIETFTNSTIDQTEAIT